MTTGTPFVPFSRRKPVEALSAQELRAELVNDAVLKVETPIPRFVEAVTRIAREKHQPVETAFLSILDEVRDLTGSTNLPGCPPGWLEKIAT